MKTYDLIIIGGGAAGLFSAGRCSRSGISTAVIESGQKPGRKLLVSGQGRCNITNSTELPVFIEKYGDKKNFVRKCLYSFSNRDLINYFNEGGISLIEREDGKIFPESERSSDILKYLVKLCNNSYSNIFYSARVNEINHVSDHFIVKTDAESIFSSRYLLLASGGYTFPSTGSTGDGYKLAESLGHNIIKPRPSLTPVITEEYKFADCAGISIEAEIRLSDKKKNGKYKKGPLLFTHNGLSGPVIIDNSRDMVDGDSLQINFIPDLDAETLQEQLKKFCNEKGSNLIKTFFSQRNIPSRLIVELFHCAKVRIEKKAAELTKKERGSLVGVFTEYVFRIKRLEGRKKAMCTAGGVDTSEINPKTMESRIINGLYFSGEVMDVDGDCGGYNLQFAFSSAEAASVSIIKSVLSSKP